MVDRLEDIEKGYQEELDHGVHDQRGGRTNHRPFFGFSSGFLSNSLKCSISVAEWCYSPNTGSTGHTR